MRLKKVATIIIGILLNIFVFGQKPNIVYILADDLGWSDTELYGTTKFYETPNIKKLADMGVTFTNAYTVNPVCSPTRSSIMSGMHCARTGIVHARCHIAEEVLTKALIKNPRPTEKAISTNFVTRLDTAYYLLSEALHDNGYVTGHFGKWHLGLKPYDSGNQGFDVSVPKYPEGAISSGYLAPWDDLEGFMGKPGEHMEDRMAKEAVQFIRENKNKPFFLNYWAFSVHSPWSAKRELTKKYAGKIDPYSLQQNPVYGAMVESFDDAVGVLLEELEKQDLMKNTIIVFFSDNGGNTFAPKVTEPEGYHNIPGTNNSPLRAGKGSFYEGGVHVPCIVYWPGITKSGTTIESIISSVDWYPTLLDMLNIEPKQSVTFDGYSFADALMGKEYEEHPAFGYRTIYDGGAFPAVWVRYGNWKLIRMFCDNNDQSDKLELYNLRTDIGETSEQSWRYPDKTKELNQMLDEFLERTDALIPVANPNYIGE